MNSNTCKLQLSAGSAVPYVGSGLPNSASLFAVEKDESHAAKDASPVLIVAVAGAQGSPQESPRADAWGAPSKEGR